MTGVQTCALPISGTAESLKVLLAIEGLDFSEKKALILGESDEDEDGNNHEVEAHDKRTKKRKVDPDQEVGMLR